MTEPHVRRMIDELRELQDRMRRLAAFFETITFRDLPGTDKALLAGQHGAMTAYAAILAQRIDLALGMEQEAQGDE